MNNFRFYAIACFLLCSLWSFAQTVNVDTIIPNDNPNTETAFLNYEYKFGGSGYEKIAGGVINIQPGVRGLLNYHFAEDSDYIFIAICDTLPKGIGITGKPVEFNHDMFDTDSADVFTEFGSRIILHAIPDNMKGNVEIRPTILGAVRPKESSYYLLFRKLRVY